MTKEELLHLKTAEVPYEARVDIKDVKIDPDLPIKQRLEDFIRQIKNPYAFKCGEIAVNLQFSSNGKTIESAVKSYLIAIKKQSR
jgi:hypothetical protein